MAFNLEKTIEDMSFCIPSRDQIDEAMGMLISYPATVEGAVHLAAYSYKIQTSWPLLYHEALLLLQRNQAINDADAAIERR